MAGFLALIVSTLTAFAAHASSVVVPDDVPTVQGALDLHVDTVFVRSASYPEAPLASDGVSLVAIAGIAGVERPVLAGLQITLDGAAVYTSRVQGFEFDGPVEIVGVTSTSVTLTDCHLKAGVRVVEPDIMEVILRHCRVEGDAILQADGICVVDSCAFTGQVTVGQLDCRLTVTNSEFHGPGAGAAISTRTDIFGATISHNVIEGYSVGIQINASDSVVRLEDNAIRDVGSAGIAVRADAVQVLHNQVERCGGYGIYAESGYGELVVSQNRVASSGAGGIYPCSGIYALNSTNGTVTGNLVCGSRSDGIFVATDGTSLAVTNNTSALNHGSGFVLEKAGCVLAGNIGFGNGAYGVNWTFPAAPDDRCNDWFGNALGASNGLPMSANDFALDPMFCATDSSDYRLHANSPLIDPGGCGLVGAFGVGCDVASVEAGRLAFRIAALGPSPSRGPVGVVFELPQQAPIELDLFDVMGRRVASGARGVWPAGRHTAEFFASGGSARLPGGVYLVRYRYPGGEARRRLIRTP